MGLRGDICAYTLLDLHRCWLTAFVFTYGGSCGSNEPRLLLASDSFGGSSELVNDLVLTLNLTRRRDENVSVPCCCVCVLCGRIVKITRRHGGDRCLRIIKLSGHVHVDRRQIQRWHCELLSCFGEAFVMVRYVLMSRRYQASVDVVFSLCLQIPTVVLTICVVLSCVDSDFAFGTARPTLRFVAGARDNCMFPNN